MKKNCQDLIVKKTNKLKIRVNDIDYELTWILNNEIDPNETTHYEYDRNF